MAANTYQVTEQQIKQIRESVDIVDIISAYLPLVGKGKNYFGVCPFHDDHSPSMSVSKEKQIYRCFSCGASGNVFKFIMDYETVSFLEALKIVAQKGGIPLEIATHAKVDPPKNKVLYELYDLAFKFYQNNINTTLGKEAKLYLNNRGIDNSLIKEFGIGLSIKDTEMLTKLLLKKGYSSDLVVKSGLSNQNDHGYHDVYYNRIMFPLRDLTGQVVGFSGRIYNSSDTAKYVNTKETEIFKKGELLYNYHRAKNEARAKGQVIIMEGFLDVIRAYTIGVKNVIATMGTAVTKTQTMLIKRMAKEVILCFDGDEAGAKATMSCSNELLAVGVTPKIIRLEENLDPDEYIQKYGKQQFEERLENPINIMDFKLQYLKQKKDLQSNQDIATYVNQVLQEVKKIEDDVLKELTLKKLSEETNLEVEFLKNQLEEPESVTTLPPIVDKKPKKLTKYEQASQNLLYYMMASEEVFHIYETNLVYFPKIEYRNLAREMGTFYQTNSVSSIADLMTQCRNDETLIQTINQILTLNLKENYSKEEIKDYIMVLQEYSLNQARARLQKQMNEIVNPNEKAIIAQQMVELKKQQARRGDSII